MINCRKYPVFHGTVNHILYTYSFEKYLGFSILKGH